MPLRAEAARGLAALVAEDRFVDPDRVRSRLTRLDDALVFAALDDLRAFARAALDSAG